MTFESEFDKIFEIVGCNRSAKKLLDAGFSAEDLNTLGDIL